MNTKDILLHLSLIKNIGPLAVVRMIKKIPAERFEEIYNYSVADFMQLGFSQMAAEQLSTGLSNKSVLERETELLAKHIICFVTLLDPEYPELLKHIHAPPTVLYVRGKQLHEYPAVIAVVGSRKANWYGQKVVDTLVPQLVSHGFAIASGGALGADTMAHKTAIKSLGKTIAVLGSGLLRLHPTSNMRLFEEIVHSGGTLVSPFNLQMEPMPGNFPARNRIISGISSGCIVVQAAAQSGASITAHCALEQGREVFAVPGPIDDPLSEGCHRLIQQGAKLVHSIDDIIGELNQFAQVNVVHSNPADSENTQETTISDPLLLFCKKPRAVDEICQLLNIGIVQAQEQLLNLELAGKLQQNHAGMWLSL